MDVVANFTPDPVDWFHAGTSGTLQPGSLNEFDGRRANYILTKYGARGLLRLKFGDRVEDSKVTAMRVWREFWTRQLIVFNQDNERRKNTNREYVQPTKALMNHAERLGIEIVGPWTIRKTDDAGVRELKKELEELKAERQQMKEMLEALTAAVKQSGTPIQLRTAAEKVVLGDVEKAEPEPDAGSEEGPEPDAKDLIMEFQMLNTDKFLHWVTENIDRIQAPTYPSEVLALIKAKWERLVGDGEFPIPA